MNYRNIPDNKSLPPQFYCFDHQKLFCIFGDFFIVPRNHTEKQALWFLSFDSDFFLHFVWMLQWINKEIKSNEKHFIAAERFERCVTIIADLNHETQLPRQLLVFKFMLIKYWTINNRRTVRNVDSLTLTAVALLGFEHPGSSFSINLFECRFLDFSLNWARCLYCLITYNVKHWKLCAFSQPNPDRL